MPKKINVRAVYKHGSLTPLEKLDLQEGAEVTVSIVSETGDRRPFRVVPNHSGFVEGIDERRLSQLSDELEADDFLAESRS